MKIVGSRESCVTGLQVSVAIINCEKQLQQSLQFFHESMTHVSDWIYILKIIGIFGEHFGYIKYIFQRSQLEDFKPGFQVRTFREKRDTVNLSWKYFVLDIKSNLSQSILTSARHKKENSTKGVRKSFKCFQNLIPSFTDDNKLL